jgi:hypothetical protein
MTEEFYTILYYVSMFTYIIITKSLIQSSNIKVQPLIDKGTLLGVLWIQRIILTILVS